MKITLKQISLGMLATTAMIAIPVVTVISCGKEAKSSATTTSGGTTSGTATTSNTTTTSGTATTGKTGVVNNSFKGDILKIDAKTTAKQFGDFMEAHVTSKSTDGSFVSIDNDFEIEVGGKKFIFLKGITFKEFQDKRTEMKPILQKEAPLISKQP